MTEELLVIAIAAAMAALMITFTLAVSILVMT